MRELVSAVGEVKSQKFSTPFHCFIFFHRSAFQTLFLFQLCGSEVGRKTLRIKGIYALLREFDRASSASVSLLKKNSLRELTVTPVNEYDITNNHSQSEMYDRQNLQVGSALHNIQERTTGATNMQSTKFPGETGNLIYIDGQNCSILHALIGLLIQD
ncbi:unnamed protein product [Cercopithifilaria johnstoni]|uniref:Protein HGH1 C-terminal domain-containing protein n=1 Tax=Cercopithifilaria johnstoni TaxID=2874296 RepID=A0A8J2Q3N6_9BILA|nr:unnamed protein product [Cercopithifilaria johnstoni]